MIRLSFASGSGTPLWLVTLADLLALLLAFFVLLFAMSNLEAPAWRAISQSLGTAFNPATLIGAGRARQDVPGRAMAPATDPGYLATVIAGKLASDPALAGARTDLRADHLAITLPPGTFFARGAAEMTEPARRAAVSLATTLASLGNRIEIYGATDLPATGEGPDAASWILSLRRAHALAGALAEAGYRGPVPAFAAGRTSADIEIVIALEHRSDPHAP
ncbi:MAG: hypothetical protein KIT20_08260 [Alphaproteobacteria bacterium]|nr:hypothetical protein [Alphaproteobacteria bacterium]